jgi:hypothetical protein
MQHTEIGKPIFFNVDKFVEVVEMYIGADEVTQAMQMMNNMPGWYRDNPPAKVVELKKHLYRKFFTSVDYAKDGLSLEGLLRNPQDIEVYYESERGQVTYKAVQDFNAKGLTPWIFELGPGSYWIPLMLRAMGLKFEYFGPSLNTGMQSQLADHLEQNWRRQPKPDQPKVFICYEMLEHLVDTSEIYHHYVKAGDSFDRILLSTPMYTYGGGHTTWKEMDLGHLRTYTPGEFFHFANSHWPDFHWMMYQGPVMCLEGRKK